MIIAKNIKFLLIFTEYSSYRKSGAPTSDTPLDYDGRNYKSLQLAIGLVFPVLSSLTDVSLVAELGHLLGLGEEFLGLVRISLLN